MSSPIENVEIAKAIEMATEEKHKKWLTEFMRSYKDCHMTVSERADAFEVIVSHPNIVDNYTGGAEQYFIDKRTGAITMGWHEHPMRIDIVDDRSNLEGGDQ